MKEKIIKIVDFINEYSLYGLAFFLPISKVAIEIFAGLAFLGFIVKKILKPDFKFLKSWSSIFLLLFIVFSALSFFNSGQYLAKSFRALFCKWLKYAGIFLFVQDTLNTRKRIKKAVFIFLAVSAMVGIDGLSQNFFGLEFLRHRSMAIVRGELYGITGPFNHYNGLGVYLVVVLSLVLSLLLSNKIQYKYKFILFILEILLAMCLMLTFSRGSWLGFVCILFLMLMLSCKLKQLAPIFIIFGILIFFLPAMKERAAFTFSPIGDADRFIVWQSAIRMIKENPFLGKGIGTFMDYFHAYAPNKTIQYAHNCYLQIWAETGIFSLLSFLVFTGAILYQAIKIFRKNSDYLLLGLICAVFGFMIQSFFDTHLYSLPLATLFWYILGLTAITTKIKPDNELKSGV